MDLDRNMSVLNTDRYDRRRFAELLEMSPALQSVEKDGSEVLPSFRYLLGDVWAGLFKNNPRVLEDVPDDLRLHRTIMEQLLEAPEFQDLRDVKYPGLKSEACRSSGLASRETARRSPTAKD